MSKQSRKPSAQPDELKQDDDSAFYVMSIPGQRKGQNIGILANAEDAEIVEMALIRSQGIDAIIQHLIALDVWDLCFFRADPSVFDAIIRSQDASLLLTALRHNRSPDYLTLLLTNATVHALVCEKLVSTALRSVHKDMNVQSTIRKQQREIHNKVPKRQMRPDNRETLTNYHALRKRHTKQIVALHKLVALPAEQGKLYVHNYRKTGEIEAVRQHIKRLDTTDRKRHASERDRYKPV